jgi:hypothetical protein
MAIENDEDLERRASSQGNLAGRGCSVDVFD